VTVIARDGLTSDPLTKAMLLVGDAALRERLQKKYRLKAVYRRVVSG
jgi:hypothetical protein